MKSFFTLALIVLSLNSFAGKIEGSHSPVSVISDRCDIFYFKVERQFLGANVEVKNADGEVIMTAVVVAHKSILDFYYESAGQYVITITKDGEQVEYAYSKASPKPAAEILR